MLLNGAWGVFIKLIMQPFAWKHRGSPYTGPRLLGKFGTYLLSHVVERRPSWLIPNGSDSELSLSALGKLFIHVSVTSVVFRGFLEAKGSLILDFLLC